MSGAYGKEPGRVATTSGRHFPPPAPQYNPARSATESASQLQVTIDATQQMQDVGNPTGKTSDDAKQRRTLCSIRDSPEKEGSPGNREL